MSEAAKSKRPHEEWIALIRPLLAPGVSNREIARRLGVVNENIISYHLRKAGLYSHRLSAFCQNGHRYDVVGYFFDRGTRRCKACKLACNRRWEPKRRRSGRPPTGEVYRPEEIDRLHALAAEGLSRRQIAARMPGRTLYSVKHKLLRLGIRTIGHQVWKRDLPRDAFK